LQQCVDLEDAADLQLNVVAALGQLARDQDVTAQAMMDAQGALGCAVRAARPTPAL
jgi:hypothetical protein